MEHISIFIFILLLQKSSNNQLYATRNPVTSKHQNIPYSRLQMRVGDLQMTTKKYLQKRQEPRVFKSSIVIKKEFMEFTQPPFKIPYTVNTRRPPKPAKKNWDNIPYVSPNYTQLKKINFHLKAKGLTTELKNDERKIEEQKRFAEQSKVVDAKKKLQMLERELEMKRELGRAALEPPKREFVTPKGEIKVNQPLSAKEYVIPKRETLKIQPPLLAKENEPNRKPHSDKSDSSSEESNDKLELNYELEADRDLNVKWD